MRPLARRRAPSLSVASLLIGLVAVLGQHSAAAERLCGRQLADMLSLICHQHGGFFWTAEDSRTTVAKRIADWFSDETSSSLKTLPKLQRSIGAARGSNSLAKRFREGTALQRRTPIMKTLLDGVFSRSRRGIVEECCYSDCTYDVLTSYCSGSPNHRQFKGHSSGRPGGHQPRSEDRKAPPTRAPGRRTSNGRVFTMNRGSPRGYFFIPR